MIKEHLTIVIPCKNEENYILENELPDFEGNTLTVFEGKFAEQDFQKVERSVEI